MNATNQLAQLAVVVAAHILLFAALLTFTPVREAMVQIIPVMASILPSKRAEPQSPPSPQQKVEKKVPTPLAPSAPAATPLISAEPSRAQPPAMTVTSSAQPAPPAVTATPAATPAPPQPASAATKPAAPPGFTPARSDAAYLNNPKPEYPTASLRLGEAGRVVLNVHVSATGSVEQASVRSSSGSERLDQAALKAVRQWKFIPARRGDEAIAAQVLVPINFNPENE